jgi:subtilisin family serine protease
MKIRSLLTCLWSAAAIGLPALVNAQSAAGAPTGRYIVHLRAGAAPAQVAAQHGVATHFHYSSALNGFAGVVSPNRLAALQRDPRVASVTLDRVVTAVAKPGGGGSASSQVIPQGVRRVGAAPGSVAQTGAGVGVAVVDTGLDFAHNDLTPLGTASFSAFGGSAQDDNEHGTHVGGIIAARNNSVGVVGVAPQATLYAVKVLDRSGNGSDATVMAGLDWVATHAASASPRIRVVNMSLGRPGALDDNPALRAAVQTLVANNIAVVVAAGNDASLEVSQQVPAAYPEVMAVASTTAVNGNNAYRFYSGFIAADTASYFTTDGAFDSATHIGVTISAPGEDQENISRNGFIQSVGILSTKLGGGTVRLSGTSMAAPHVAGVVALLYEKFGATLTPEDARTRIILGANNPGAPLDSPTSSYSFDGDREGILFAPSALGTP